MWDDDTQRFHMLVTAAAASGPTDARGVIGHAWSRDLRSWEAGPLFGPGEFRQLEVPQLVHLGGAWRILFSATQDDHGAERLRRTGVAQCGTHYLSSAEKFGAYTLDGDDFLVGDEAGRFYADGCCAVVARGRSSPGGCATSAGASSASCRIRCPWRSLPTARSVDVPAELVP